MKMPILAIEFLQKTKKDRTKIQDKKSQNRTTGQTKKMAVQSEIMSNRGRLKDSIKMELYGTLFYKKPNQPSKTGWLEKTQDLYRSEATLGYTFLRQDVNSGHRFLKMVGIEKNRYLYKLIQGITCNL